MLTRGLVLFAAGILLAGSVADEGRCADTAITVRDAAVDLAVPESPALTALGLGPNMVERPSSPREFSASLLHGLDTNGDVQTGISFDVAPFLWYLGEQPLEGHQDGYLGRFLNSTLLSFAAAHGDAAGDVGTRFALGVRFTPWDEGDPRRDEGLSACLRDAVLNVEMAIRRGTKALQDEYDALVKQRSIIERRIGDEAGQAGEELGAALRDMVADMDRKMKALQQQLNELVAVNYAELNDRTSAAMIACRSSSDLRERLWDRSAWSIGIVPSFVRSTGANSGLLSSGTAVWTSVAFDVLDLAQLILHAREQNNEQVQDPAAAGLIEQDSFRWGVRARFGKPDLNFSIEGVSISERAHQRPADDKVQYGVSLEHRIADDVWFSFSVGSEEYDNRDDNLVVLANLRWAYTPPPAAKH